MKSTEPRPIHIIATPNDNNVLCGIRKMSPEALPYVGQNFWQARGDIKEFCASCVEKAKQPRKDQHE